jgi:hypothetical protein
MCPFAFADEDATKAGEQTRPFPRCGHPYYLQNRLIYYG